MFEIAINGKKYKAEAGETLLPVLLREGFDIPYLCFHHAVSPYGSCRLCIVDVAAGAKKGVTPSCTLPVAEGLQVETDTPEVIRIRKILLELYLAEAPGSTKIQQLAKKYGVESSRFSKMDITIKGDRCVLCGLCARVCSEVLGVGAINFSGRGVKTSINTPWYDVSSSCIGCGACAYVCPADAIDIITEGDERVMKTWHNTSLKLKECAASLEFFATEKGLDFINKLLTDFPDELKAKSPESRKIEFAKDFSLLPKKT